MMRRYIEIVENAEVPSWFYHGTTTSHLDDILRNGLVPQASHDNKHRTGTYLTDRLGSAQNYTEVACDRRGGEPLILAIPSTVLSGPLEPDDWDLQHMIDDLHDTNRKGDIGFFSGVAVDERLRQYERWQDVPWKLSLTVCHQVVYMKPIAAQDILWVDFSSGRPVAKPLKNARRPVVENARGGVDIDRVVETIRSLVPEVEEIWFHGSRATGKAKRSSDWDFYVFVSEDMPTERFIDLASADGPLGRLRPKIDIQVGTKSDAWPGSVGYWVMKEGRKLWSKVVENARAGKVVYHASPNRIAAFHPLSHFGTERAAHERAMAIARRGNGAVYIHAVELSVRNPLTILDDEALFHTPMKLADMLHYDIRGKGKMTADERGRVFDALKRGNEAGAREIVSIMEAKGYDGFVYRNYHEDAGSQSWVNFRPEQVRVVGVEDFDIPVVENAGAGKVASGKIVTGKELMRRYGGAKFRYRDLPESAQKSLTHWMTVDGENFNYKRGSYGYVEVPIDDLMQIIYDQLGVGQQWDQFWGKPGVVSAKAFPEIWALVWADDGWNDGMHRLNRYRKIGLKMVPVVVC